MDAGEGKVADPSALPPTPRLHWPPLPRGQTQQPTAGACTTRRPRVSAPPLLPLQPCITRQAPPAGPIPLLLLNVKGRRPPAPASPENDLPHGAGQAAPSNFASLLPPSSPHELPEPELKEAELAAGSKSLKRIGRCSSF